ncbi:dTDP-4-dehydrorhamnose reductase family protein [Pseudomonas sp. Q1-7]|uniref:dTDP-4-dehydrorhamnose reductase family protein n=1 Tax=Pseudomonas sp. Q1-7 TaxID=3020843 RepID=UPI0023014ABA|nr:SDR family oxidoreductase [Pseudomonas sp. Q1-7]
MRVLVLGVTGMLGNAVYKIFDSSDGFEVWGTLRNSQDKHYFPATAHERLMSGVDVLDHDMLVKVLARIRPQLVINCVGLIKQLADSKDPLSALPINAMLPHRLANLCGLLGARLIQLSTDCVFSGRKGYYVEDDVSDAEDLYGKSKYIGEIRDNPHVITLRTSIIGHELSTNFSLVDWFLAQEGAVKGFSKAIFSGLPTAELARVMKDFVAPNAELSGLYHVATKPISKHDLLKLIAKQYGKKIEITPDDSLQIDRSLNGARFNQASGYVAPEWSQLISIMHESR